MSCLEPTCCRSVGYASGLDSINFKGGVHRDFVSRPATAFESFPSTACETFLLYLALRSSTSIVAEGMAADHDMSGSKDTSQHYEAAELRSPSHPTADVEKNGDNTISRVTTQEDAVVTAKTWAVVGVRVRKLQSTDLRLTNLAGTRRIVRPLLLADTIFQHHPDLDRRRIRRKSSPGYLVRSLYHPSSGTMLTSAPTG